MLEFPEKDRYNWEDFLEIVRLLRSPGGCPWDREQTHSSIRRNFLEETWEALDAIDRDDLADMREELGDVLLQELSMRRWRQNGAGSPWTMWWIP